jgi:hypothetical protein
MGKVAATQVMWGAHASTTTVAASRATRAITRISA